MREIFSHSCSNTEQEMATCEREMKIARQGFFEKLFQAAEILLGLFEISVITSRSHFLVITFLYF